ncbi:uncharacterized protein LOC141691463 [Apium graveolens]|uniref:uncharacterized protein LOC141691463 n=1 Tax=Apium graveolens TaxID=4045 RepID=UPI003D78C83B
MGRIGIHPFKAVSLTYHMILKFATKKNIGEDKRDHKMGRSFYVAAFRPYGTGVDPLDLDNVTYIGASLEKPLRDQLTKLLQENNDVFSWTTADMPGIDPNLITHKLNVDPTQKAVQQKKITYAPNRLEAIKQESEKLLEAGFFEEVQFPEWLVNPVMVKKSNGEWRMGIDFSDLNDACPKAPQDDVKPC